MTITANDLQTKGVAWLEDVIESNDAAIITVQGAEKYIVLKIDEYNRMREAELDFAIAQTKLLSENTAAKKFEKSLDEFPADFMITGRNQPEMQIRECL